MPETASAYIAAGEDASTRAQDFSATAERNYMLTGKNIKVTGDDPSVGITLTDSKGKVTRLTPDMIAVNEPSKLLILLPAGLADDDYTLTITTQYGSGKNLAIPRAITQTLYVGKAPSGGGNEGNNNESGSSNESYKESLTGKAKNLSRTKMQKRGCVIT
jgi:hypothetical protein